MTTTAPARNASRAAWAAWADQLGITYPADAGRTAIMAAIDNASLADSQPRRDTPQLLVLIPSRGRPGSVPRMVEAWHATDAFAAASMRWVLHADDPALPDYQNALTPGVEGISVVVLPAGAFGMAPQVNAAARLAVELSDLFALGVMGDDHLPRTTGWAARLVDELHDLGAGIVYGNDLLRGERLPTAWAMTADIVRTIGRAVPALVQHLYSDNAVLELGRAAGCIRYLPDVVIEHMHPTAGKASWDEGYRRVNGAALNVSDRAAFERWRDRPADASKPGLASHAAAVRALRQRGRA